MKFKTILFITLFLYAVVLTHQATLDEPQEGSILDKAREAERKALGELKLQYENAKQQFKTAFKKVKINRSSSSDSSDSDSAIQKGISDADEAKSKEWKVVSELKAQAQKAKGAYKSALATEHRYLDELKAKAKNAKQQFKAAFNKARGVSSADSSDSDAVIQEEIKTAETTSDTNAANEWKGISALKTQAQKAKEAYKAAKANLKSKTDSLTEEARAAENKAVNELKSQAKNAKEQFKTAFKKLKINRPKPSDSSDSDAAIQKGITDADEAKSNEWKVVSELKAQAQKAKDAYKTAKSDLKSRIKKTRESSDSSDSESSDSSDDVDKSKFAAEWGVITQLKNQAKRAKETAKKAYKKLKNLYRSDKESSDSSSDSSDGGVAETAGEKVAETIQEKAVEEAQSLLEQARNAQITAYLELKEGARKAKNTFKNAYRDLKARIKGEKSAEQAKPQVETDL